ncbi:unnamed protein product [Dibothriocephalus latus]|uniref:Uncharacterized protein n=1 Tax=Dibothriocephalus latus TaxID=60516 RepID=A0A3P7MXU9_DIBLA|nr:unnamed protein product [Dibothriocephalus latus]
MMPWSITSHPVLSLNNSWQYCPTTLSSTRKMLAPDFFASFKSALQKCEANEKSKNAMRQQVSTLFLQHKPQTTISEAQGRELMRIQKMKDIVTLPADKGRSTVVMDKTVYMEKLQGMLGDENAWRAQETRGQRQQGD